VSDGSARHIWAPYLRLAQRGLGVCTGLALHGGRGRCMSWRCTEGVVDGLALHGQQT